MIERHSLGIKTFVFEPPFYASRSLQNKRFATANCKRFLSTPGWQDLVTLGVTAYDTLLANLQITY